MSERSKIVKSLSLRVVYKFCPKCGEPLGYVSNVNDEHRCKTVYGDEGFGDGDIADRETIECQCGSTVRV